MFPQVNRSNPSWLIHAHIRVDGLRARSNDYEHIFDFLSVFDKSVSASEPLKDHRSGVLSIGQYFFSEIRMTPL
jgi:hypothetical protein